MKFTCKRHPEYLTHREPDYSCVKCKSLWKFFHKSRIRIYGGTEYDKKVKRRKRH